MTTQYEEWKQQILTFYDEVSLLASRSHRVAVESPDSLAWYELLHRKLIPELSESRPYLVVAIVGGTNIGKSLIFNHLAAENASAVSHRAAGTRHPVCLIPEALGSDTVQRIFREFQLCPWNSPQEALEETNDNRLFYKTSTTIPKRLILIDAPDVDSTATINWKRADAIRNAADVLVAILTQQKYNDAAMKKFFREAALADKPVILIFNMVDLEGDRDWWDDWITTFREETGIVAESIWIVPRDRLAAAERHLAFYRLRGKNRGERTAKTANLAQFSLPLFSKSGEHSSESASDSTLPPARASSAASAHEQPESKPISRFSQPEPASLQVDLSELRFDAIRIRTFRGAIRRMVDPREGAGEWLAKLRSSSERYQRAVQTLEAEQLVRVDWPNLPPDAVSSEIWRWWDLSRPIWVQRVHGFYRTVSRSVISGAKNAWKYLLGDESKSYLGNDDPLTRFRNQERLAIQSAIERLYSELQRLAEVGEETLRERVSSILSGASRTDLLLRLQTAYEQLPTVDEDFRAFLAEKMETWRSTNKNVDKVLRYTDYTTAILRPAISIGLFVTGFQFAGHVAGSALFHAAQDTAIGAATTVVGDAAIQAGSDLTNQVAAFFLAIQEHYVQRRAEWLAHRLEQELLGDLLTTLREGAEIGHSPELAAAEQHLEWFREHLQEPI
ncbi:MAG: 50S ribosome-binding GTPase [Thermoguttaceae bacterium]|nr:50S ribosome-binding GTPase [Thermoguttaceae bacterium]